MGERVRDRLQELKEKKLKWILILAALMMVGMFCMAFVIVAFRAGSGLLIAGFGIGLVVDITWIIWIIKKKFGDLDL
jgi:uncharacterized membrane protein (DUF485 family)